MAQFKDNTDYVCEILSQGFTESKNANKDTGIKTPAFVFIIKPVGECVPNDPENVYDCPSHEREVKMWITDKTFERIMEDLRRIGFEGTKFTELDPDRPGHHSFVGQQVRFTCKWEVNGDKTYDKFELPFWGSPRTIENQGSIASKLDNLFGKDLKKAAPAAKQASKPAPAKFAPKAPIDANAELQEVDSDMPF